MLTTSQDWWPADFGHYGPFMIRMAWHSAGTYRISDGRGGAGAGQQRFAPLNSWPDNGNLDKARRLLWPVKKKYGQALSWADLMVLTGNVALESMGFETFGFAGGREDVWEPDEDVYWGPETEWLGDERYSGERDLEEPLGAVQMGLIYVNPEGPNGNPDPLKAAVDIRETFARMAMNDEETVALIAGGHTFGKTHGAADPLEYVGAEPEGAPLEAQGLGWSNSFGTGKGADAITSGIEVTWTATPTQWGNSFFDNLFGYEWELTKSPAGAHQWRRRTAPGRAPCPGPTDGSERRPPTMLTTDLSLRLDPVYGPISQALPREPGRVRRRLRARLVQADPPRHGADRPLPRPGGPVRGADLAGPGPEGRPRARSAAEDVAALKAQILDSGLTVSQLVSTAWASASTFRGSDKRGGANGARIRLEPQRGWEVNDPEQLATVLEHARGDPAAFGKPVSLADLIVLAGSAGVEQGARDAGVEVEVPFTPGRTDATEEQTDADSFAPLEPTADGFRNYLRAEPPAAGRVPADRPREPADPQRARDDRPRRRPARAGRQPGRLVARRAHRNARHAHERLLREPARAGHGVDGDARRPSTRAATSPSGDLKWTGSRADLVFGSNSELRALAEVYASDDAKEKFVRDFAAAWVKVMNLDRFDVN